MTGHQDSSPSIVHQSDMPITMQDYLQHCIFKKTPGGILPKVDLQNRHSVTLVAATGNNQATFAGNQQFLSGTKSSNKIWQAATKSPGNNIYQQNLMITNNMERVLYMVSACLLGIYPRWMKSWNKNIFGISWLLL